MSIQEAAAGTRGPESDGRTGRILFVDDDAFLLEVLRAGLRGKAAQWSMRFVSDPREALEACRQESFDLVVADVRMPGMDGVSMIEAMRQDNPGLPSILLSGAEDFATVVDAVNRVGIARYLRKPCTPEQLVEAIAAALRPDLSQGPIRAAFEEIPLALLLVDAASTLLYANRRAASVLAEGAALQRMAGGRVAARDPAHAAALRRAIEAVASNGQDDVLALPRSDGRGQLLLALTVWGDGVMIHVQDAQSPEVLEPAHLSKLFALTPSEGRLVHALASTASLEEAAGACGITLATARTYLKVIFAKTRTRGQVDLVRLVMGLPRLRARRGA